MSGRPKSNGPGSLGSARPLSQYSAPKRSDKPRELVQIDDLVKSLQATMARAQYPYSRSLVAQLGKAVSQFCRQQLAGHEVIYPGMAKMAKWGGCKERQARKNFACLRDVGVFVVHSYERGGKRSTRFSICFASLYKLLVQIGANPSPQLREKIEVVLRIVQSRSRAKNRTVPDAVDQASCTTTTKSKPPAGTPVQNPGFEPVQSAAGIESLSVDPDDPSEPSLRDLAEGAAK